MLMLLRHINQCKRHDKLLTSSFNNDVTISTDPENTDNRVGGVQV